MPEMLAPERLFAQTCVLAFDVGIDGESVVEGEGGEVLLDLRVAVKSLVIFFLGVVDVGLLDENQGYEFGVSGSFLDSRLEGVDGLVILFFVDVAVAEKHFCLSVEHRLVDVVYTSPSPRA